MIPIKPADATWTDDQWKAIWAKDQDILVAAAAGSGKTAVLVERMIQKVLSQVSPINVDELLVVTFTNASAAEMKHRVGQALEKAIEQFPESKHLRRQASLLNKASISTLHSFCLEVIRTYYYLIDIDPGFRIADDAEAELLKDEVMEEMLEQEYGQAENEPFFRLVDALTSDRSDQDLQQLIRKLHTFSRSHADPDGWLDELVQLYNVPPDTKIDDHPLAHFLLFHIQLELEGAIQLCKQALETTRVSGGPYPRAENFEDDIRQLESLKQTASWSDLYDQIHAVSFTRLKACKGDEFDEGLLEQSKKWRDQAKKMVDSIKDSFFIRKPENYFQDMREMTDQLKPLVQLVKQFHKGFSMAKAERGLVDFADLEHFCLAILMEQGSKESVASEAAMHYQRKFKEVLVDEYQDTNMVQETILQLVKSGSEKNGNLFMVGDVKQSIYRFRLAEPNLFLSKYRAFSSSEGMDTGLKIDLSQNFRSRPAVLDATNYLFRQIMGVRVGEVAYNREAELKKGAPYPEDVVMPVEVAMIDQSSDSGDTEEAFDVPDEVMDERELEKSQLEARYMIKKIRNLIDQETLVYDIKSGRHRPLEYRDIVILTRSMTWTPDTMEEFKQAGIPLYANVSTGYFEATEVAIMVSLLKIIDNPHQDIPLASVLRSPIVRCSEEQLGNIRTAASSGTFYDALQAYAMTGGKQEDDLLRGKVEWFIHRLNEWRKMARSGALAELIWQLYRDTQFYDFVGGLPSGKQRQANLRALYDRARQYESTSFRGLFRFLRFVERMRERGDDLGAARALSEQEDVVRLMTIHSSKGLEFPVVFISGMARPFNQMDLRSKLLLDKDFGLALPYVQAEKRISYDSLPQLALKEKKRLENLSEEMRVLYVAMTRSKERLYMVGTLLNTAASIKKWNAVSNHSEWQLPDYTRKAAKSYFDWIGPALVRHPQASTLREGFTQNDLSEASDDPSKWLVQVIRPDELILDTAISGHEAEYLDLVSAHHEVPVESDDKEAILRRLTWKYPYRAMTSKRSKQSVSEIKRMNEVQDERSALDLMKRSQRKAFDRPSFLQETKMTATEKGTVMHAVMQQIPVTHTPSAEELTLLLEDMITRELITPEQKLAVNPEQILAFFETDIGRRVVQAQSVQREIPFTYATTSSELGLLNEGNDPLDQVIIQGIIDCLFEDENGLVLLDYKTDRITDRFEGGFDQARRVMERRYTTQLKMYKNALEKILGRKINQTVLFFFDGAHVLELSEL
ncbi:helicase-exonuclease AddAB subunit AddA [Jeotgalibacillus soli]|uniref:ATP-dependent helicase/nuclease subunit A n=1 Tax=Jeotgalibacillus soli TaxID=889306 RepID=A0A0C2VMH5_9BACL|nr:helicase-exonuclease AddAB subunit AddA [Jeotgalibacillus soli]KIL45641.1 ATP-dependent helicase [Jeotgalibacillus soli]